MPTRMKLDSYKKMIRLIVAIKCHLNIKKRGRRNIIIMMEEIHKSRLMIIKIMILVNKLIKKLSKQSVKKSSQFTLSLTSRSNRSQKFVTLSWLLFLMQNAQFVWLRRNHALFWTLSASIWLVLTASSQE